VIHYFDEEVYYDLRTIGTIEGHVEQFKLSYDLSLPVGTHAAEGETYVFVFIRNPHL